MDESSAQSNRVPKLLAAMALFAAVGGVAFWIWRERAPLARWFQYAETRRDEERDGRGPNPQKNPGTSPL